MNAFSSASRLIFLFAVSTNTKKNMATTTHSKHPLVLHVKRHWFDAIVGGYKPVEYRECTDYWKRRIEGKKFTKVLFINGYGPERPRCIMKVLTWTVEKIKDKKYYAIFLGELVKLTNYAIPDGLPPPKECSVIRMDKDALWFNDDLGFWVPRDCKVNGLCADPVYGKHGLIHDHLTGDEKETLDVHEKAELVALLSSSRTNPLDPLEEATPREQMTHCLFQDLNLDKLDFGPRFVGETTELYRFRHPDFKDNVPSIQINDVGKLKYAWSEESLLLSNRLVIHDLKSGIHGRLQELRQRIQAILTRKRRQDVTVPASDVRVLLRAETNLNILFDQKTITSCTHDGISRITVAAMDDEQYIKKIVIRLKRVSKMKDSNDFWTVVMEARMVWLSDDEPETPPELNFL